MMPNILSNVAAGGQMPQNVMMATQIVMTIFMFIIYIFFPCILIMFYAGKNVKATVETRNPKPSWTDRCPLPVLALTLLFAGSILSVIQMASYNFLAAFFGVLLTGAEGAAVLAVVTVLLIYIAVGIYKLKMHAWWTALLVVVAGAVSNVMTFSRISIFDFYRKMGFPEQQIEMIRETGIANILGMKWYTLSWSVVFVIYLLLVRKYFTRAKGNR